MQNIDFSKFGVDADTIDISFAQLTQMRVDEYNNRIGEDDGTGVRCNLCHGKGDIAFIDKESANLTIRPCKCYGTRLTINRLKKCGIWESARSHKLNNFTTDNKHQKDMKTAVERFIASPDGHWLMLCGQSGAGKTHLCTAAFTKLSYNRGLEGRYLRWVEDGRTLKGAVLDDPKGLWDGYKKAELLYIDDLFKDAQNEADRRMAFELLDYRYSNRLVTIISSELSFDRLMALDQAIAGRIKEMCGPYLVNITQDPAKNFRISHH